MHLDVLYAHVDFMVIYTLFIYRSQLYVIIPQTSLILLHHDLEPLVNHHYGVY